MEADCEMEDAEDEGLITSWVQENNAIVTRWKSLEALGDAQGVKLECYSDLSNLLQTIQGLPPTMQNLNLELTALCNTVILHINITGGFIPKHQEQFSNALNRVLECRGQQEASEKSSIELWEKVLARVPPAEIPPPLIRLAGLQSALWLAENRLEHIGNLLHVLQAHVMADQKHDLLQLVKMWEVPQEAEEGVLSLESACHVKDILYTTIAFQQGLHAMDAGKFHQAVTLLQEAASGLCTNKVLSELYTCLGYCFYKMGKPQTALQFWKKALSVDFHCLPALYHTSRLYSDTGRTEPELEVLRLLHMALTSQDPVSPESLFLFRTELILKTPILDRFVHVPTSLEVKYLIANRCLRNNSFQELLELVADQLKREDTFFRCAISPCERLVVTLRYLATGTSYSSLQYEFRISKSTISGIVVHTSGVLWAALKDKVMPVCDQARWLEVAELFWERTNFPNCLGAIDGKHIRLVMPPASGSKFFNYKKYFSIVLMAIVDANYNFICVDVGSYGSASDSAVFQHSAFGAKLREGQLDLPEPRALPGTDAPKMPMVFVGDEAFPISNNFMRPYCQRGLDQKKRVFNYRLCRARRMVECTFGILANKWRVLHTPISLKLENAIEAVKATCVLHNYVRARDGYNFEDMLVHELSPITGTVPRGANSAFNVRDSFANYFVSTQGELEWQYRLC